MTVYAGLRWRQGEVELWKARVEEGHVLEEGPGGHSKPAWALFDGLVNYHTHVGDASFAGRPFPRELDALARPETGWKHVQLARTPREDLVAGIAAALEEYAANGIREVWDFREQGPEGLMLLREALRRSRGRAPRVRALGRPARLPASPNELEALFHLADGVGIPSLSDWGARSCRELADEAHRRGKLVAMHFAEARPEDVGDALALRPHLLVHACQAGEAAIRRIRDAGTLVVVCPSSNEFFGLRSPVALMERLGVPWTLGTDNAMLGGRDLLREARLIKRWHPGIPDERLAGALTAPAGKVLNRIGELDGESGVPARLALLPLTASGAIQWGAEPLFATR